MNDNFEIDDDGVIVNISETEDIKKIIKRKWKVILLTN